MSNFLKFQTLKYYKFQGINFESPVILLEVFPVNSKESLSNSFLQYDTKYKDSEQLIGDSFYKLPTGELLVLLFKDSDGKLFTTIRSRYGKNGDKLSYYRTSRNSHFWIEEV